MGNESVAARLQGAQDHGDARLGLAIEEAGLSTWDTDLVTGESAWSTNHFRLFGYPVDPAGRATFEMWSARVHPEDRERVLAVFERAKRERTVYRCEHRIVRADTGEVVWIEPHGRFQYDSAGCATRLIGVCLVTTARKQAEENLVRRETQLDLATRIVGIGVFDHDHTQNRVYWSDQFRQIHGILSDVAPDVALLDEQTHPEDREPLRAAIAAAHDPVGAGRFGIEYRIRRTDGEVRWIVSRAQTFFVGEGADRRPVRTVGAEFDVTDRKRIEMDLRAEHESLRLALEASAAGAFDWEIATDRVDWTDGHYRILGLEPKSIAPSYELWRRHVHPEDVENVDRTVQDALAGKRRYRAEYRIRRVGGQERWVEAQGLTFHERDRAVRMVGVVADVTDRRLAEARLRESEARFRTMADGSPVMIWATDAKSVIEFVNKSFCEFFGVTPERVEREGWQRLLHPDDALSYVNAYEDAVAKRTPFRAQARVRSASGEWRWIESYATPRIGPHGEFLGYVGVSPDVTALLEAQAALREADQRKDQFLATLAHELRNPLAPIRTAAQMLTVPNLADEQLSWACQVIHRQVKHMARLLDDLLDVARITRGTLQLKKEAVHLGTIVDTAVEAARPLITARKHGLTIELPPELPTLDADPVRLAQVVSNLLTNAAKYTDPPGNIVLTARVDGDRLRIAVKDNGIGLSPSVLADIFGMFSQGQDAQGRAEGGLGIGLALVKGLVNLHGGTVEAFSEGLGTGSEFVVTLPCGTAGTALPVEPLSALEANRTTQSRKILIADDNQDAGNSLAMLLRLAGHDVCTAYGGEAALELASTFRPEIAFLDIGMPDLNGYEVARQFRRTTWGKRARLVALTGWGQEEDKRRAREAGFDHHLTKPVARQRLDELLSLVGRD